MSESRSVIIVGDLFPVPSNFEKFSKGDTQYLLGSKLIDFFSRADYRICNLEGALTDRPGKCEKTGPALYAPTSTVNAYKKMGIDCCTLANNHITDAGPVGVIDTMKTLNDAGIVHLGAGEDSNSIRNHVFFTISNKVICLFNVGETMYNEPSKTKPGAYLYDEYIVCKELEALKKECDYLIVVYHGGIERFRYPSPQIRRRFHRMADSGANMVLSQHTHCVGCEEQYNGSYLLYGQGNFLFRSFNNEFTDTGLIVELNYSNNMFVVKRYLVNAIGDTVRYADVQDFSGFDERSSKVIDVDFVQKEFESYCMNDALNYLEAYKGLDIMKKIVSLISSKLYRSYVLKSYRRPQLLFTLHSLRSEQNREVAIEGIKQLLTHFNYK